METEQTTAPAESAPATTADIAAETLNTLEAESQESAPEPAADPVQPTTAELSEEEQLLHEFGFKDARRPDGREHYISRSKVLRMIASGLKRGQARWEGEKTGLVTERDRYKADFEQMIADVRGTDTRAFLERLAGYDPRYRAFLEQRVEAPPAAQEDPEPGPDVDLGNGRFTYSIEGLKKRDEWRERQWEKKLDARLKPLTEREQADKERADMETRRQQTEARATDLLKEAQTWPMFGSFAADGTLTPFQQEVLAAFKADPKLTLHQAYMKVATPKWSADRNAVRQELIEEQNKAPRSTAVTRTAEPARTVGPVSTRDIAARTLAALEKGGA